MSGLCACVAVPRGMEALTTVLYSAGAVAATFSEVTPNQQSIVQRSCAVHAHACVQGHILPPHFTHDLVSPVSPVSSGSNPSLLDYQQEEFKVRCVGI